MELEKPLKTMTELIKLIDTDLYSYKLGTGWDYNRLTLEIKSKVVSVQLDVEVFDNNDSYFLEAGSAKKITKEPKEIIKILNGRCKGVLEERIDKFKEILDKLK